MKTLAQIKALCKLITGKNSTKKTTAGVIKDIVDNITVTADADTKVITITRK